VFFSITAIITVGFVSSSLGEALRLLPAGLGAAVAGGELSMVIVSWLGGTAPRSRTQLHALLGVGAFSIASSYMLSGGLLRALVRVAGAGLMAWAIHRYVNKRHLMDKNPAELV
jgi:hypothetical protein